MFLIKNYIPVKSFFTLFLSLFFLSSCSDKKIVHSNYIPSESNIVLSINTAKIFNTAAFDLIGYNNLFNDLSSGPISSMILNPADAGLKMLSKYHFFLLGSNLLDVKFGAILPLSDGDELADYITKNLQAEIIKSEGFQTAKIPGNHNLVWDDYTAVYYSGAPGGDLMNEAKNIFEQKSEKKLAEIDSTFSSALNSNAHISMWIKNNQVAKLIDQGLMLLSDLNVIDLPLMKTNISEQGKTVFLTNFNEGNITINQLGYLSSKQTKENNKLVREKKLESLITETSSENPLILVNTSLRSDVLLSILKLLKLDEGLASENVNSSVFPFINQLVEYIDEDVFLVLDSFEDVSRIKQIPDIDDEGNDVLINKKVIEKIPDLSIAFLVKDSLKFNFMLNVLGASLPKEEDFFNYNNQVYFGVKEDLFFITSTKRGVKAISKKEGLLPSDIKSIVQNKKSEYYLNIHDILKQSEILDNYNSLGSGNLINTLFYHKITSSNGVLRGELEINFINQDENSLLSILKLISGIASTLKANHSIGIE